MLAQNARPKDALVEFRLGGCNEADAHANVAFALALAQSWPEARAHYERALAIDPQSIAAHQGLKDLDSLMAKTHSPQPNMAKPATSTDESSLRVVGAVNPPDNSLSPYGASGISQSAISMPGNSGQHEPPLAPLMPASTMKKEAPEMTALPARKAEPRHFLVPVSDKPSVPAHVKTEQPPAPPPPAKLPIQQASKTGKELMPVSATAKAAPEARPAEPFVTHGTIMLAESAPPTNPQTTHLKQRIADSCAIPLRNVELLFTSASDVEVKLQARNQAEANTLAERVLQLPELHPYKVDVKVQIPR